MNVGIIGAGSFAKLHAQAIEHVDGLRLKAVSRRDLQQLQHFTNQFSCKGYSDYRQLLDDPDIDTILIATPHHRHLEPAIEAIEAGKHLLIEKPLAHRPEDCQKIVDKVVEAEVMLMTGHISHFTEASFRAAEILESGKLGGLVQGQGKMWKAWENPDRRDWHRQVNTGGGALMTVGIHFIDFFTWISNCTPHRISADLGSDLIDQEADSSGNLLIKYEEGASYALSMAGFNSGVHEMSNELICTGGMLKVDNEKGLWLSRNGKWEPLWQHSNPDWMLDALVRQWKAFQGAVENNTGSPISGEYGKQMVEIVHAAYQSSKEKTEIALQQG
jgi:predicted dehydrogenase